MTPIALSLLLPAYNEGPQIAAMIDDVLACDWARDLGEQLEIIVVDDGSTDDTAARAEQCASSRAGVRVLRMPANGGKGRALAHGVRAARGAIIAFVDSDRTFHLDHLPAFLERIHEGADIVVGNRRAIRTVFEVQTDAVPYIHMRHVISATFNRIVRTLTPIAVPDTQCGLKVFTRAAAHTCFERIRVGGFVFDIELLLAAHEAGFSVHSLPVRLRYDSSEPTGHVVRMSAHTALDLLQVATHHRLGRYRPDRTP